MSIRTIVDVPSVTGSRCRFSPRRQIISLGRDGVTPVKEEELNTDPSSADPGVPQGNSELLIPEQTHIDQLIVVVPPRMKTSPPTERERR